MIGSANTGPWDPGGGLSAFRGGVRFIAAVALSTLLASCGGGGGGSIQDPGVQTQTKGGVQTQSPAAPASSCSTTFTDSFGQPVTCAQMLALAGAALIDNSATGDSAGVGGGAGGDGTAADGAPIRNATIRITDVQGRQVETTTDNVGYFRVNLGGLKSPLVAEVVRGQNAWRSALVEVVKTSRENRTTFYTINLTGLTDLVLSEVAKAANITGGSNAVTAAVLAQDTSRVGTAVNTVKGQLTTQLVASGVDPASFDPLKTPFKADQTGYDKVLESVTITKAPDGGSTQLSTALSSLPGQWALRFAEVGFPEEEEIATGIPGSAVPDTLAKAQDFFAVNTFSNLAASESVDGFSYTVTPSPSGFTIRIVKMPSTDQTLSYSNSSVRNFVGCGSCGVGSKVSFDFSYTFSSSGKFESEDISSPPESLSNRIIYVRTQ
jgi:hypothetical protein